VLLPAGMAAAFVMTTRAASAARFLNCIMYNSELFSCIFAFSGVPRIFLMKGARVLYIWSISARTPNSKYAEAARGPLAPLSFLYEKIMPVLDLGSRTKPMLIR
jgi:hypothetical protein